MPSSGPTPRIPHTRHTPRRERPILLLVAFVLLVFCTGTAEYLVSGVLPTMAHSLGISIASAGQTVTAYAMGVAIGGPVVAAATARLPRRRLALGLCALFIAGLVLTIVGPSLPWVLVGRVMSACTQATLFAIALTSATRALGDERSGRAVAIVGSGLTVATVLGVPLGVLLGGTNDWRLPFAALVVLALAGTATLAFAMPAEPGTEAHLRTEVRSLLRGPVLLALATTVFGFAGVGVVFTYLVPLLTDVTGLGATWIPGLLLLYGAGGFVGNLAAGRLTDISLPSTLIGVLVALVATLVAFPLAAPVPAVAIALVIVLGLLSTATIAPLQTLVLHQARQAPTLALAVNVGAFNLANAIGATVGGWAISSGLLAHSGWIAAPFAVVGLVVSALAVRRYDASRGSTG